MHQLCKVLYFLLSKKNDVHLRHFLSLSNVRYVCFYFHLSLCLSFSFQRTLCSFVFLNVRVSVYLFLPHVFLFLPTCMHMWKENVTQTKAEDGSNEREGREEKFFFKLFSTSSQKSIFYIFLPSLTLPLFCHQLVIWLSILNFPKIVFISFLKFCLYYA